jgi:hypothetical protein
LWTVCLGSSWTWILTISASKIARITGIRHHAQLFIDRQTQVQTPAVLLPSCVAVTLSVCFFICKID